MDPGYGETPLLHEELDAFLPEARAALPYEPTKSDVYDLEQAIEAGVREELLSAALNGDLGLDELLGDHFVRDLHRRLYADVWTWGGRLRTREVSIGIAPEQISVQLRSGLESIRYRWENTADWTAHVLGLAVHAETTRIHPFVDGNGRSTRLLADLVLLVAQPAQEPAALYDWDLPDKRAYIEALRHYDSSRDPGELAAIVRTVRIGGGTS